jgi:hypothetical protein
MAIDAKSTDLRKYTTRAVGSVCRVYIHIYQRSSSSQLVDLL